MLALTARRISRHLGAPSPALLTLARLALEARAAAETVRPVVEAHQRRVLGENHYFTDNRWHLRGDTSPVVRIVEPSNAYEMSEDEMSDYCERVDALNRAAGFEYPAGQCPLLIAEDVQAKAEAAFGRGCAELRTGIDPADALSHGTLWPEYLALMFRYVVPFVAAEFLAQKGR